MSSTSQYRVRAVQCDYRASDEEVYQALKRAASPLSASWKKLKRAERITIKFNQAWPPDRLVYLEHQLQELVDPVVARATLRLLREETDAEIVCTEISTSAGHRDGLNAIDTITLLPVLKEFGVEFAEGNEPPHTVAKVPGGGLMFDQYLLPESVVDADGGGKTAFVSVQKLKNHKFMGVTLCLKNLFGLTPMTPLGRSRQYFHHIIRLSYVLADLGRIIQPALNIIDGLVGQSGQEWGGDGRICNTLVAGEQVIATDACGTHLMGHDPLIDWPNQPFLRDRSSLLIAHQNGFGTAKLDEIDFQSEVEAPVASFATNVIDPSETVLAWRRSTCEQALYYRDHAAEFVAKYAGEYILLQDGEVRWHDADSSIQRSRRDLAGANAQSAMWFKLVDPEEPEGEHFEVYEQCLDQLKELGY